MLSALGPGAMTALRARLEALTGVERVLLDEGRDGMWVIALPDSDHSLLEERVRAVVADEGLDPDMSVELATHWPHPERHRVRLVDVEREPLPDGRVRARVSVEWNGRLHGGEEVGESGITIEMRTAAAATVKAIQELSQEDLRVRLIGVKQTRAFDQEITVVSLYRDTDPAQRLVGAVLTSEEPLRSPPLAVLDALNRVLGSYLSPIA